MSAALLCEAAEAHSFLDTRAGSLILLIFAALCLSAALVTFFAPRRWLASKAPRNDRERLQLLAAEFERYKRRTEKEQNEAGRRSLEALVTELLPAIDNMDRALGAAQPPLLTSAESVIEGVQLVQRQLFAALKKFGVDNFEPKGEPFDPRVHEAVQADHSSELTAGSIVRVFQRGYTMNGRLLRPARVSVACDPKSGVSS